MRHQNVGRKFGRMAGPREALMRGLATNFILKGKMKTTDAKAREIKPIVEKLITLSKKSTLTVRRQLLQYLYDEAAVNKLLKELGPKYQTRLGGYTRLIKLGNRQGDNAKMAILELV
jgi:large subunit ribosomal protein L17